MKSCICPECKNDVDLARYPQLAVNHVIECDKCGITLEVINIGDDGIVDTTIVDSGK